MFDSKIEWTDHTFNPWIGCQKVSAGCDNCYAEQLVRRYGWTQWGPRGERVRTSDAYWRKPLAWARSVKPQSLFDEPVAERRRPRVFCASLADVFDNKAPAGARMDLWQLIRHTPELDWQLLTKRPENMIRFLPDDWNDGYPNVWLGITCEDQAAYDRRWGVLAATPARIRFISYEPAIGPLSIWPDRYGERLPDWLIWGGESGPGSRLMVAEWARCITAECQALGIAVFGKQWGNYMSNPLYTEQGIPVATVKSLDPPVNGKGGAMLDGTLYREFPP